MYGFSSRVAVFLLAAVVVSRFALTAQAQTVVQPLCVMNIDGTEMHEVAAVPTHGMIGSPNWSADGEAIAFDAHGPGFSDQHVFVVELATGEITDLGRGGFPSFAPDSERVAFHHGLRVMVAHRDGSNLEILFEQGSHPRFSRDGKLVAYRTPQGDNMGIYDVETGKRRELFDEPTTSLSWGRDWSPDGKRIVLRRPGPDGSDELVLISTEGTSKGMKVRYRGDMSSHASWSHDGSQILVGVYLPAEGPRHLHYLAPDSREKPTPIPGQNPLYDYCDGTFSPDGEQVAFGMRRRVSAKKADKP